MPGYVELMTERALVRTVAESIARCWAVIIGGSLLLVIPGALWTWHARELVVRERQALEARYDPLRRLSAANRVLGAEASELIAREKLTLELARRRPAVALLAHVSSAVAASEGAAYLERIVITQDAASASGPTTSGKLTLEASTWPSYEASRLTDALERPPLTVVKIVSSETLTEGDVSRKKYVIECEF